MISRLLHHLMLIKIKRNKMQNPYLSYKARIRGVKEETPDVKTFQLEPGKFGYMPGQFLELSILGAGEAPISITSSPTRGDLEIAVKRMGRVTGALHELEAGDHVWIRGAYGNGFPVDRLEGKEIVFVGGGIGIAPLRSLINYMIDKKNFGKMYILYGARTPSDLVFKDEFGVWNNKKDVEVHITVDRGDDEWSGNVGVVGTLLDKINTGPDIISLVCGPPIMIKFVVRDLLNMNIPDEKIIFSLERMMKCGVGKCGHCNIGGKYVCSDGPVFTLEEMKENLEFKL